MFFSISTLKSATRIRYAYNIDCGLRCLSNAKSSYFPDLVEFEKVYVRFLINRTFKIVGMEVF